MNKKKFNKNDFLLYAGVFLIAVLMAGVYYFWTENNSLKANVLELEESLRDARGELARVETDNTNLSEALLNEQNKVQMFDNQLKDLFGVIGGLTGTVGTLDKLSKTDPELLKKYSKVYFLSEHYTPELLSVIDSKYIYDKTRPQQIHVKVAPYLQNLLSASETNGVNLRVVSAYRSFGTQADVKTGYSVTYGAGTANQFSADQGYSEHQLGSTVDFTSTETEEVFYQFEKTEAYKWLTENAYKYGFVLSYPPDNDYYRFEPWHWRFVGKALAGDLHNNNKYLYEMSQREIDEYLVKLFD